MQSRTSKRVLLFSPTLLWKLFFLISPFYIMVTYSIYVRSEYGGIINTFSIQNYLRAIDLLYFSIFLKSLKLATLTTFSCLFLGYPLAYVIAVSSNRIKKVLLMLVALPFWTNLVVRAFSIRSFFPDPSAIAVWVGMVSSYLPLMVLPIYLSIEKFDFQLLEAARDLGARGPRVFIDVLFPLTLPGVITGISFVFIPSLGEFVIPDLLGGAKSVLIGNLITDQFLKARDWPFGAALSCMLIILVIFSWFIFRAISDEV